MWPWGHAAVGYLLYSGWLRTRRDAVPSGRAVLAVGLGTQFPDLVDKPLAWTFGVLPTGRSLAHSWLLAVLVLVVGWRLFGRHDRRRLLGAFGVGWLSHGFADAVGVPLGDGGLAYLNFLAWPVLSTPPYETGPSFHAHLTGIEPTPYFLGQLGLLGVAVALWWADGRPGLALLRGRVGSHGGHQRSD